MADGCDFGYNDLYSKKSSSGEECAQFCIKEDRCTHFTYSTLFGKTINEIVKKHLKQLRPITHFRQVRQVRQVRPIKYLNHLRSLNR